MACAWLQLPAQAPRMSQERIATRRCVGYHRAGARVVCRQTEHIAARAACRQVALTCAHTLCLKRECICLAPHPPPSRAMAQSMHAAER
jgi:hypothetical protein